MELNEEDLYLEYPSMKELKPAYIAKDRIKKLKKKKIPLSDYKIELNVYIEDFEKYRDYAHSITMEGVKEGRWRLDAAERLNAMINNEIILLRKELKKTESEEEKENRPPEDTKPHKEDNKFVKKSDVWVITFGGEDNFLKHKVGLQDIQSMLKHPGKSILPDSSNNYDPVVDKKGLANIKEAKKELEARIQENKESGYPTEKEEDELEIINEYLKKSVGLGGKSRVFTNDQIKSKNTMQRRYKRALDCIENEAPAFYKHLMKYIDKNTFTYNPDKPIPWGF